MEPQIRKSEAFLRLALNMNQLHCESEETTMRFAGKTVVITGASSGIGRLAALSFAKEGANLGLIARSSDGLGTLAAEIREAGGRSFTFAADVTEFEKIKRATDDIAAHFGGIDIWVNNAGTAVFAETQETSLVDTRRVMDVNFFGQVHGVLAALPYLEKSRGQIIAILSVDSEIALPFHSAYVASKHALYGYYKVFHEELLHKRSPIKVSTILPASIATPFFEHAKTQLGVRPKPIPPVYSPEYVVKAIMKVAERPKFSTVVGGSGRSFIFMFRHFPNLFYRMQSWISYPIQRSTESKFPESPNNLYNAVPQSSRVIGKDKPTPIGNFIESKAGTFVMGLTGILSLGFFAFKKTRGSKRRLDYERLVLAKDSQNVA
jgi:short-subunit dehydrogenase